jgi:hypothetical protein
MKQPSRAARIRASYGSFDLATEWHIRLGGFIEPAGIDGLKREK